MIPRYYEFNGSVKIICGIDVLSSLAKELRKIGGNNPILISGPVLNKIGAVDKVKKAYGEEDIAAVFTSTPNDSSLDVVDQLAQIYKDNHCDSIIACGGGSVIDTAKGLKLLLSSKVSSLKECMGIDKVKKGLRIPFVVIPTTSGTGSEVTKVSVISDTERGLKLEFISSETLPDFTILDPQMTVSLPPRATMMSGFDTLTHAIEAYISIQKNPLSDAYALMAISKFRDNIKNAVSNPTDLDARLGMMESATLAGFAFSNAMVGVVHAIGHSLGAVSHIGHDVAMALLLPYGLEFNKDKVGVFYSEMLYHLISEADYKAVKAEDRSNALIDTVRKFYLEVAGALDVPKNLKDLGVDKNDFSEIVNKAMRDGAILANAKGVSRQDVANILELAYEG